MANMTLDEVMEEMDRRMWKTTDPVNPEDRERWRKELADILLGKSDTRVSSPETPAIEGPYGRAIKVTEAVVNGERWLKAVNCGFAFPISEIARIQASTQYDGVSIVTHKTGNVDAAIETATLPIDLRALINQV